MPARKPPPPAAPPPRHEEKNGGEEPPMSELTTDVPREEWLQNQLQLRIKEFSEAKPIRIFCGTWNVNASKPIEDLVPWLITDPVPDVYVIGLQEMVDLNAGNLIVDNSASKAWEEKILQCLSDNYKSQLWVRCSSKHMVGVAMMVFARVDVVGQMVNVQSDSVGVGVMGVGGNKGGVAIRFQLYDSKLCFVNSHLAAHQNQVAARNSDYHNICKKLSFQKDTNRPKSHNNSFDIFSHEFVFWMGDLNYRINSNDMDMVHSKIKEQDWEWMIALDQLIQEKKDGNAFSRFKEGELTFAPTFKYTPGTHHYDRPKQVTKQRIPSWCDRIQWVGEDVSQLFYRRTELVTSDHKPVSSVFEVQTKVLENNKKRNIYESLGRQLDVWENENIPKVRMTPKCVDFGNINFDTPITLSLLVHNIGQVAVKFSFVAKFQEDVFCKRWLSVSPQSGIIAPNTSQEIDVTLHVTKECAQDLTCGKDSLDDILILRLENGRDYFVTVSADYLKSSFGASIDWLLKVPTPVRFMEPTLIENNEPLRIPKELWRIINYMYSDEGGDGGIERAGLMEPTTKRVESIRESLDTGLHFAPTVNSQYMFKALLLFLEKLNGPVFPEGLCEQFNYDMNITVFCRQCLMQLPPGHYSVFIYVIAFLKECLKKSAQNKCRADEIVILFSKALMHLNEASGKKHTTIIDHFLTSSIL